MSQTEGAGENYKLRRHLVAGCVCPWPRLRCVRIEHFATKQLTWHSHPRSPWPCETCVIVIIITIVIIIMYSVYHNICTVYENIRVTRKPNILLHHRQSKVFIYVCNWLNSFTKRDSHFWSLSLVSVPKIQLKCKCAKVLALSIILFNNSS